MMMDVPRTDYKKDRESAREKKREPFSGKINPKDKAIELNRKSLEKARAKRKEGQWSKKKLSEI